MIIVTRRVFSKNIIIILSPFKYLNDKYLNSIREFSALWYIWILSWGGIPFRRSLPRIGHYISYLKGVTKSHYGSWSDPPPPSLPSHHSKWEPILLLQISLNQWLKSAVSLILEKSIAGIIEQTQELITNIKIQSFPLFTRPLIMSPSYWNTRTQTGRRDRPLGKSHEFFFSFAFSL